MKIGAEFLKKQEEALTFLLVKPSAKFTSNDFHQLRLEIKKLNAFLDLVNFCSNDFNRKKVLKAFTKIFRKAGKIRELQLEEQTIKKQQLGNLLKEYLMDLKWQESKEEVKFFILVKQLFPDRIQKKINKILPHLSKINDEKIKKYLEKKNRSIQKLMGKSRLNRKEMHQLRKQLKTLNYNRKTLSTKNQVAKTTIKEGLTSLLGKWHDCEVLLQHLKKEIAKEKLNYREIHELHNLKTAVVSKRKLLFNKINTILPSQVF
jgi:CHAD domain-containing protein